MIINNIWAINGSIFDKWNFGISTSDFNPFGTRIKYFFNEKISNMHNRIPTLKNIMSELKPGDRFYTPSKNIDYAFSKAIKYNSSGLKN